MALDFQPVTGEEHTQQQGDEHLGHRTLDPHEQSVGSEFQDADGAVLIRGKELYIILEAHEFRPHLGQALPVVLEKALC